MTYHRCSPVLLPLILLLALTLWSPVAARAQAGQAGQATPSGNQAQEYLDREEQERRERVRREQESLHEGPACPECSRRGQGIQVRPIPQTRLVAVLHDIDVDDSAVTVRLRFYNDGPDDAKLAIDPTTAYESFFVEVGGEKRFIRRDDDGKLDAKKSLDVDLRPGKMESWWAKFPALPAGTESFDVVIPPADRFVNVPVDEG